MHKEQEAALVTYLERYEALGVHARPRALTISANSILRRAYTDISPPPTVSHSWTLRFLERHPTWKKRKQAPIEAVRAAAYGLSDIEGWFEKLHAVIQEHGITPEDIWMRQASGLAPARASMC